MTLVLQAAGNLQIPITGTPIVIGNNDLCQVKIKGGVANRQCQISLDGDTPKLLDLSGNGTIINGENTQKRDLNLDDIIQIGNLSFKLVETGAISFPEPSNQRLPAFIFDIRNPENRITIRSIDPFENPKPPDCTPLILEDPDKEFYIFYLDPYNRVTIGRLSESSIVTTSDEISRLHCEIFLRDEKVFIRHFSDNTTKLNGQEIVKNSEHELYDGNTFTLSGNTFKVIIPSLGEELLTESPPVINNLEVDSELSDRSTVAATPANHLGNFKLESLVNDSALNKPTEVTAVSPDTSGGVTYEVTLASLEDGYKERKSTYKINGSQPFKFGRSLASQLFNIRTDFINGISGNHLELYIRDGKLFFKDISRLGTSINGTRIAKDKENILNNGDIITLGNAEGNWAFRVGVKKIDSKTPPANIKPWWKFW